MELSTYETVSTSSPTSTMLAWEAKKPRRGDFKSLRKYFKAHDAWMREKPHE